MTAIGGWLISGLLCLLLLSVYVRMVCERSDHKRKCAKCARDIKAIMAVQESGGRWSSWNASQKAARK